jgi:hypothetical protein
MKRTGEFLRQLWLLMLLCGVAAPTLPQTPSSYTVEIVVFRHSGDVGAMGFTDPLPAFTGDDVQPAVVEASRLGSSVARLNRNGLRVLGQAAWRQAPAATNSRRGVSAARLGLQGVSGKIVFERGQFLLLGVDLVVEDGGQRFHINEMRRQVKAGEVQYFDHPAVGVLAVVTGD